MDYELRIVVEKVVVSSQEVVKRDTIASYALQCPTSIVELGLRHGEQIALLAKIQDILYLLYVSTQLLWRYAVTGAMMVESGQLIAR